MTSKKLKNCIQSRGPKAAAEKKIQKYPSAYANAYASKNMCR